MLISPPDSSPSLLFCMTISELDLSKNESTLQDQQAEMKPRHRKRWIRMKYVFEILDHAKQVYQNTLQEEVLQNFAIQKKINLLRGSRLQDTVHYKPTKEKQFKCIQSGLLIDYIKVNDDYCDCPRDGSDEPGTSACSENGRFYCTFHQRASKPDAWIPSGRVNDGICDCCDGSDEWQNITVPARLRFSEDDQRRFKVFQAPCTFKCFDD
ncbi:Hypothetical predicted protein [Cloeon dipterum]|uniref:Glucosidase II beta subunit N-terminal domain-containing protein n=1 Tax=Cloeon dipterum TaxID=197152 RepID=A0A8S1BZ92_9INSE|nr:Hypothetical predicted protein [Cloeon dipterum]